MYNLTKNPLKIEIICIIKIAFFYKKKAIFIIHMIIRIKSADVSGWSVLCFFNNRRGKHSATYALGAHTSSDFIPFSHLFMQQPHMSFILD
jgi:hypothetical protein